jgi:hypothetical protein
VKPGGAPKIHIQHAIYYKGTSMRTAFMSALSLTAALVSLMSNSSVANASEVINCVPQTIQEYPNNSTIQIITQGDQLLMTVSTFYWGAKLSEKYIVSPNGEGFSGDGIVLTISDKASAKGFPAVMDSKKDGVQKLFCNQISI